ncbi:MAG TPA: hypothetical protein VI455_14665 [Terriglobia bacterium]
MARRLSKKQLILESRGKLALQKAGERELRLIQKEVSQRLAAPPSLSYIATVLRQAGTPVDYEDPYTDPVIPPRYANRLQGTLKFDNLSAGEASLRSLDAAFQEYVSASDHTGAALVRKLVLRGKQRAQSLAGSPRVNPEKRREKTEIASWFRVWLESPGLFFAWLEVRKQTEEFGRLFPSKVSAPSPTGHEP